jgi:hypothetical protein
VKLERPSRNRSVVAPLLPDHSLWHIDSSDDDRFESISNCHREHERHRHTESVTSSGCNIIPKQEKQHSTMTDTVPLTVKWGKETFTLDFVVASGVKGLKSELEERTSVPADRMKLMAKSKGESLRIGPGRCNDGD